MSTPPMQSCHTRPSAAAARPRRLERWCRGLGLSAAPTKAAPAAPLLDADEAWSQVLRLLPDDVETTVRTSGALQRRRAVVGATAMVWLVLAYAVGGWSLRLVAGLAAPRGVGDLSHVAVRARLRHALPWVQQLVSTLLGFTRAVAVTDGTLRLRLVDATTVSAPGSTGTDWRLHASVWLAPDGPPRLDHLELTDAHGAESLRRHPVAPGDVVLADRGHARRTDLGTLLATPTTTTTTPVHVVVRIGWQNLPLQHPALDDPSRAGSPFALVGWLPTLTGPTEHAVVTATPRGDVPLRLVATPLPEEVANVARHRLRRQAKKSGRTPDARSVLAAGYVLLVTNLPADRWNPRAVLALYRVRWQVELVFKRLKSIWHLDHLRAYDPALAQVFVLGTLLGALLADRASPASPASPSRRNDGPPANAVAWFLATDRPVSLWRWTALWHLTLLAALLGPLSVAQLVVALPQLRRHLCDPPRRRPQQAAHTRALLGTRLAEILHA